MRSSELARPRRTAFSFLGWLLVGFAAAAGAGACAERQDEAPPPPAAAAAPAPAELRAKLDESLRLAGELKYEAAIALFEQIREKHPEAVTPLDGLKLVVVYSEVNDLPKFEELTRWLVDRHRTPRTATDAERSVKGYIVDRRGTDRALLAHAVDMTRYAAEHAAAQGEGQYQGFFDTSRGVAEYRMGRHAEAAKWLATTTDHQSVYVRTLALPFYAMATLAQGRRAQADTLLERARTEARGLPKPGTEEYAIEWTDTLISHRVLEEAEATFRVRPK
jgi:hypothetical protein